MTFPDRHPGPRSHAFYRNLWGRPVSTLGIGTYLGELTPEADSGYIDAVHAAVAGGINLIDTAINYRQTRSERNIGEALQRIFADGIAAREDLLVCTKAGFLTPGAVPAALISAADVAAGSHCMAPAFLQDQIGRSLQHLGLDSLDVFYLHNPETQLQDVSREVFESRLLAAFATLEDQCRQGRIHRYGAATWSGFRLPPGHPQSLELDRMLALAAEAAGSPSHHFQVVQLPFNLAMTEAARGDASLLRTAAERGVTVVASAPLVQGRLLPQIPAEWLTRLAGPRTPAEFALQFTRSTPGIAAALTGMGRPEHVRDNLALAAYPPASPEEMAALLPPES